MKTLNFVKLCAIAVLSAVVVSCSSGDNSKASGDESKASGEQNVTSAVIIPENAVSVLKFNLKSLYDKSLGDGSALSQQILNQLKENIKNSEAPEIFTNMLVNALQNPMSAFGFDFNKPIIVSACLSGKSKEAYMSVAVSDRAILKMLIDELYTLRSLSYELQEYNSDGYGVESQKPYKETLNNGGDFYFFDKFCCVLTEKAILVYLTTSPLGQNGMNGKATLEKVLAQTGCTKPGLDNLLSSSGDVALWIDMEDMNNQILNRLRTDNQKSYMILKNWQPYYKGSSVVTDIEFRPGKTVASIKFNGSAEYNELIQKYYAKPTDAFLSKIPASSFMACNLAVSSQIWSYYWNTIANDPQFKPDVEQLKNIGINEEFVAGLPGTITAGFALGNDGSPAISLAVECDRRVYDIVMPLLVAHTGLLEDNGNGTYALYGPEYSAFDDSPIRDHIGAVTYIDGAAVAMTSNLWYESNGGKQFSPNYTSSATSDELAAGGIVLNLKNIPYDLWDELLYSLKENANINITPSELFEYVSSIIISIPDGSTMEFSVNMGDTQQTLLQKIIANSISRVV